MAARAEGPLCVRGTRRFAVAFCALLVALAELTATTVRGQLLPSQVIGEASVSALDPGMPAPFLGNSAFGVAVAHLGDLDGDGLASVAVGAPSDSSSTGAVFVLELEAGGGVSTATRIGDDPFGMGVLTFDDRFGRSLDAVGDLDGDGTTDLAVGAPGDSSGAVWILFLTAEGGLKDKVRIGATTPGFCATLAGTDELGRSVAALGDRDGDGSPELAVGAANHDFGGSNTGAVFILSLSPAGGLTDCTRIASGENGLPVLDPSDQFGASLAVPGDLDGDGDLELAVGAVGDDDGGADAGVLWLLTLGDSRAVTVKQKLTAAVLGGVAGTTNPLGSAVGSVGDLDGDGVADLAVGVPNDDDGAFDAGAVWSAFLQADGTPQAVQKLSNLAGGFGGGLVPSAAFGSGLPPSQGDPSQPLLVGAPGGGPAGDPNKGAAWQLTLTPAGTVASSSRLAIGTPGLSGGVEPADAFGTAAANLGDLDGDGRDEFAIGAPDDDDGFTDAGALWLLEFDAAGALAQPPQKRSVLQGGVQGVVGGNTEFGYAIVVLGDLSGDGTLEVAVGAPLDDTGTTNVGAVWLLSLGSAAEIVAQTKLSALSPGWPPGALGTGDDVGSALAAPGDLDGDGVPDLLVGAKTDDDGGSDAGAVWVLLLTSSGAIKGTHKLSDTEGGLGGGLATGDQFGSAIAVLGDTDGDGRVEIAVGAPLADVGGTSSGTVWLIELQAGGAGASHVVPLNALTGGLPAPVFTTSFGTSLATLPDLDADGRPELVAGAPTATLGFSQAGAIGIVSLRPDGSVRDHRVIGAGESGFGGELESSDSFGRGVCPAGDQDGNGAVDLVAGAPGASDAVWTVHLERGAWSAQGTGVPGTHGVPLIATLGPLAPGTPLRFELNEARRYAPCFLFLGITELLAPFKGGVLVPNPVMVVPQTSDGFGFKSFGGTWPPGVPAGSTLYAQWWVMDPNAIQDLSATAGAKGVVP